VVMRGVAHLADAFRWSTRKDLDGPAMVALALGTGAPILLAAVYGTMPWGMAAALGALMAGNARTGPSFATHVQNVIEVLAAATMAAIAAGIVAGQAWWTDVAVSVLACFAATFGGYSRPLAVGSGRFIVFLVITIGLMDATQDRLGLLALITAGAVWASALILVSGVLFRGLKWIDSGTSERRSAATAAQKFRRWKGTLKGYDGWQYAVRLALTLGPASVLRLEWPSHHFRWIALTVAILCHRQRDAMPIKITQRAVGAMLGVAATSLLIGRSLPGWAIAGVVAALAGPGPWLRTQNYLAYTTTMTPLIILLFDGGKPVEPDTLVDRLIATLIGAILVILANVLTAGLVSPVAWIRKPR